MSRQQTKISLGPAATTLSHNLQDFRTAHDGGSIAVSEGRNTVIGRIAPGHPGFSTGTAQTRDYHCGKQVGSKLTSCGLRQIRIDLAHQTKAVPYAFLLNQFAVGEAEEAVVSDFHEIA
jgi:hypothetical protein